MAWGGPWSEVQYGVIVDRTEDGLGYYLAYTSTRLHLAQAQSDLVPKYPSEIRKRTVTYTEWEPL